MHFLQMLSTSSFQGFGVRMLNAFALCSKFSMALAISQWPLLSMALDQSIAYAFHGIWPMPGPGHHGAHKI